MRVLHAKTPRPFDLLAIGLQGHVAAASSRFVLGGRNVRGDVTVWGATGDPVGEFIGEGIGVSSLAFAPHTDYLVIGQNGALYAINLADHTALMPFKPDWEIQSPAVAFNQDCTRILISYAEGESFQSGVLMYQAVSPSDLMTKNPEPLWSDSGSERVVYWCPVMSGNKQYVATAVHDSSRDRVRNLAQVRLAATGEVHVEVPFDAADPILQIAFSADSSMLLAQSTGRVVKVFDVATGRLAGELVHPGRVYVSGMAVHPDGTVACCRQSGAVCLWDLERWELVRTLDWKIGMLFSVAFSPDGLLGAAGNGDGGVVVWDVDP